MEKTVKKIMYHSSDVLFNCFDNSYIKDMGFHFGLKKHAYNNIDNIFIKKENDLVEWDEICYLYECEIALKNTYKFILDCWNWSFEMVSICLNPQKNSCKLFTIEEWEKIHNNNDLVFEFKKKGYDSIEYHNTFEGDFNEASFIVFDSKNIKILKVYECKVIGRFLEISEINK